MHHWVYSPQRCGERLHLSILILSAIFDPRYHVVYAIQCMTAAPASNRRTVYLFLTHFFSVLLALQQILASRPFFTESDDFGDLLLQLEEF